MLEHTFRSMNQTNFRNSVMALARQYRARINVINIPTDLCNGTEWDMLSQKIWAKYEERRQSRDVFEKKMDLWNSLRDAVEVYTFFKQKINIFMFEILAQMLHDFFWHFFSLE